MPQGSVNPIEINFRNAFEELQPRTRYNFVVTSKGIVRMAPESVVWSDEPAVELAHWLIAGSDDIVYLGQMQMMQSGSLVVSTEQTGLLQVSPEKTAYLKSILSDALGMSHGQLNFVSGRLEDLPLVIR
jgi:hypothetical protein